MGERNTVFKLQKATVKAMCKCHSKTGKETVKLLIVKSVLKSNKKQASHIACVGTDCATKPQAQAVGGVE